MTIEYEVIYPVDWLDTNPTKKRFKTFVSLSDEKSHAIASVIISIN